MTKQRRLGRGLAALLGEPLDESAGLGGSDGSAGGSAPSVGPRLHRPGTAEARAGRDLGEELVGRETADATEDHVGQLVFLQVHEIDGNPFQPRREFGESEIASLAESLREHDMLQPVLVRRVDDRWQLISGERRLRAAIHAGWTQVPARVREADDRLVAELAIVENLQRKDLNPIEKALSFSRYLKEHQCTQDDLGKRLKIDRSTIANLLRLLELPDSVQESLRGGTISAGHARALLPLGEDREQIDFCNRIRREGLSVRDTERMVQEIIQSARSDLPEGSTGRSRRTKRTPSRQIATLEEELRVALGTKVEIRETSRGRGRIVIHFSSHEEFERLRGQVTGESAARLPGQVG